MLILGSVERRDELALVAEIACRLLERHAWWQHRFEACPLPRVGRQAVHPRTFCRIITSAAVVVVISLIPAFRLSRFIRSPATVVTISVYVAVAIPRILRFTCVVVRASVALRVARGVGPTGAFRTRVIVASVLHARSFRRPCSRVGTFRCCDFGGTRRPSPLSPWQPTQRRFR